MVVKLWSSFWFNFFVIVFMLFFWFVSCTCTCYYKYLVLDSPTKGHYRVQDFFLPWNQLINVTKINFKETWFGFLVYLAARQQSTILYCSHVRLELLNLILIFDLFSPVSFRKSGRAVGLFYPWLEFMAAKEPLIVLIHDPVHIHGLSRQPVIHPERLHVSFVLTLSHSLEETFVESVLPWQKVSVEIAPL